MTVGLFVGLTSDFLRGFIESMATLCSQAQGSGNRILVGNYIQLATVFFVALNIPFAFMWIAVIDDLMEWLGFDEETASIAKEYTSIIVFVNIIDGVNEVVHEILDIIGHEVYSTVVNVTDEALTTLAIVGIVLGRNPSLYQVGLVTLGLSTAFTVFNFVVSYYRILSTSKPHQMLCFSSSGTCDGAVNTTKGLYFRMPSKIKRL